MSRKYFFGFFSKYLFRIENFLSQNILKVFLETTLVHVSCYPDQYETKIFFSIFEVRNYPSIYDFELEVSPCNALELESGSSRYRKYVSRMTWIENFLKPLFSTIHVTLFIISRNFFFKIGKNENFDYKINENCPIGITKIGKK